MKIVETIVIKPLDVKWIFIIKDNGIYEVRLTVRGFVKLKELILPVPIFL